MPDNIEVYASEFWNLYQPPISNEVKSQWLNSADNDYDFYRAFVPFFYKILAETQDSTIQNLRTLSQHKGWIVGDPHPANFGAILTLDSPLQHSVLYTINDPDDGFGDSPLFVDFLRFLTGIRIIDDSGNPVHKIRKAYLQGLKGKHLSSPPPEVSACLKRLWKYEKYSKKADYKRVYEEKKKGASAPVVEISSQHLAALKTLLAKVWKDPNLKIEQGFEYIRKKGGSGGLGRKVLLLRFSKKKQPARISKSKWLVVELKELRRPSSQYFADLSAIEVINAKKQTLFWQSKNKLSDLYRIVKDNSGIKGSNSCADSEDRYWLVRPRWVENPIIDPMYIEHRKQRNKIYLFQAQVLGNLHRAKAIDPQAYHKHVKQFKAKVWNKAAEYMTNVLSKIARYKNCFK